MWQTEVSEKDQPIGYLALVKLYHIQTISHYRWSFISKKWQKKQVQFEDNHLSLYFYPPSYKTGDGPFFHLEFALKNEGVNLFILKKVFEKISPAETVNYISQHPTGKYTRLVWFFYENLTSTILEIPDAKNGEYIYALDPEKYYTSSAERSQRHRVFNNLPGSFTFCPLVRKTSLLKKYEDLHLDLEAHQLVKKYEPEVLIRAMNYLYTKETLSSWEIEREKPDNARLIKFTNLLKKADSLGPLTKKLLIDLQKEIVDPRFMLNSYRDFQNYIGEEPKLGQLILHYISPRPQDVENLMEGLLLSYEKISLFKPNTIAATTILAFGLVFIHPFWDGNGRLHRFLIHYALNRSGYTPKNTIFPVSAVILKNPVQYDQALESFSKALMELITNYSVNDAGEMTVLQETKEFYQFIDMTPLAEYLFSCIEKTIKTDFEKELQFLSNYDKIKGQLKEIVDMPEQKIDLFIKCLYQNGGRLSAKKRQSYFPMLTETEIKAMESIIAKYSHS